MFVCSAGPRPRQRHPRAGLGAWLGAASLPAWAALSLSLRLPPRLSAGLARQRHHSHWRPGSLTVMMQIRPRETPTLRPLGPLFHAAQGPIGGQLDMLRNADRSGRAGLAAARRGGKKARPSRLLAAGRQADKWSASATVINLLARRARRGLDGRLAERAHQHTSALLIRRQTIGPATFIASHVGGACSQ